MKVAYESVNMVKRPLLSTKHLVIYCVLVGAAVCLLVLGRLLGHIRLTFVHYHMDSDADAELVTLPKKFASPRGAHCLDGSPSAYYFRPSPILSSSHWMIHLPGGGWCTTEEDCFQRSLTPLGSSHVAPTSITMDGALSKNCNNNPDFCLWNVVVFLYCDGGSFLGNQTHDIQIKSRQLYMRGAVVFDALMEFLTSHTGMMEDAEQVVLSGTSAGGLGALIHADLLRSRLPPSVHSLHVLLDGSMFVDVPDDDGQHTMAKMLEAFYYLHSVKDTLSVQECTRTKVKGQQWRCVLPQVYQPFVFTPNFFVNSIYDTWQRTNALKVPCFAVSCPEASLDTVYKHRDAIKDFAGQVGSSRKNGVFLTACPRHILLMKPDFYKTEVGNPSVQKSITSWLQHSESKGMIDIKLSLEEAVETCSSP